MNKYALKMPKKNIKKCLNFTQNPYPHCPTPPPPLAYPLFKINNIHIKDIFIHPSALDLVWAPPSAEWSRGHNFRVIYDCRVLVEAWDKQSQTDT